MVDNRIADFMGSECTELFYSTDDFPEIHLKQAHLIKKLIKAESGYADVSFYNTPGRVEFSNAEKLYRRPLFRPVSLGKGSGAVSPKNILALEEAKLHLPQSFLSFNETINAAQDSFSEFFSSGDPRKNYEGLYSEPVFIGN